MTKPTFKQTRHVKQRVFHGMARQDKLSSFHMARAALERKYSELLGSKVDMEQRGAEGD